MSPCGWVTGNFVADSRPYTLTGDAVGARTRPLEEKLVRQEQFGDNGGTATEIEAESDEVGRGTYGIILSPWDAGS